MGLEKLFKGRTHQSAPNVPYALEAHWTTLAISGHALEAHWTTLAISGHALEAHWTTSAISGRALEAHWTDPAITWSCPGSSLDRLGHHVVMPRKFTGPPRPSCGHALEAHWTALAIMWSCPGSSSAITWS
ncbi:hypothetical protein EMCRGX_G011795 [Ephydatia muelleri]